MNSTRPLPVEYDRHGIAFANKNGRFRNSPPSAYPLRIVMPTPEEIAELAMAPKRTTTDEGTVEERDMKDVLEAVARAETPDVPPWGMRIARTKPRGTV